MTRKGSAAGSINYLAEGGDESLKGNSPRSPLSPLNGSGHSSSCDDEESDSEDA